MRKFWKPKPKPKYDLMVKEGSRGSWRYYCYSAGAQVVGTTAFASTRNWWPRAVPAAWLVTRLRR